MSPDWPDRWLLAAFADPIRGLWGVIRGGHQPEAAVGRLSSATDASADGVPTAAWHPASALELTPDNGSAGPVSTTPNAADALSLVRVAGTLNLGDESLPIDAPGVVVAHPTLAKLDSVRILAGWFPADRAVVLSATRPRGGHADKELVSVLATGAGAVSADPVAPGDPEPLGVFDPRLSTTYDGQGLPLRAGIELWLGPDEDSDQRPLRLSSESTGDRARGDLGDLQLDVYAQRCHNRGEDGVGLYALLRPR